MPIANIQKAHPFAGTQCQTQSQLAKECAFSYASWAHPTSVDTDVIVTRRKEGYSNRSV
jgi:hypothetical protein